MPKVLFVCLGNICRSPLGEGILRRQAAELGLDLHVESAGTGDWHVGQLPDPRAIREGERRGCIMDMRARQVAATDFEEFDLIVAMDVANERDLHAWKGSQPTKVRLARTFDPDAKTIEVPDPYYGGLEDFASVADQLEAACRGILRSLTFDEN